MRWLGLMDASIKNVKMNPLPHQLIRAGFVQQDFPIEIFLRINVNNHKVVLFCYWSPVTVSVHMTTIQY